MKRDKKLNMNEVNLSEKKGYLVIEREWLEYSSILDCNYGKSDIVIYKSDEETKQTAILYCIGALTQIQLMVHCSWSRYFSEYSELHELQEKLYKLYKLRPKRLRQKKEKQREAIKSRINELESDLENNVHLHDLGFTDEEWAFFISKSYFIR